MIEKWRGREAERRRGGEARWEDGGEETRWAVADGKTYKYECTRRRRVAKRGVLLVAKSHALVRRIPERLRKFTRMSS